MSAPRPVGLEEFLDSRERRAARIAALAAEWGLPVLSFTVVAPGPLKDGPRSRLLFRRGVDALASALLAAEMPVRAKDVEPDAATGPAALFVVDSDPVRLKALLVRLEEEEPAGRLFDLDAYDRDGRGIRRSELGRKPRPCIVCGRSAKECGRSRAHPLAEVEAAADAIAARMTGLPDIP